MKRWWVQKYKLPTNHPLFRDQSLANLNLEMMEDLWMRENELQEKVENEEGSHLNEAVRQLKEVRKALGIVIAQEEVQDPLVEKWEREIAEGKIPDLDEEYHG